MSSKQQAYRALEFGRRPAQAEEARRFAAETRAAPFRAMERSGDRGGGRDNACFEMSISPPRAASVWSSAPRYDTPPRRPAPLVITYNWHENVCFDGPLSPDSDGPASPTLWTAPDTVEHSPWGDADRAPAAAPAPTHAPGRAGASAPASATPASPARREPPLGASAYNVSSDYDRCFVDSPANRGVERLRMASPPPSARRRLLVSAPPPSSPPSLSPTSAGGAGAGTGMRGRHHMYTEIDNIASDAGKAKPPPPPPPRDEESSGERTPPLPPRCPRDLPPFGRRAANASALTATVAPSTPTAPANARAQKSPLRSAACSADGRSQRAQRSPRTPCTPRTPRTPRSPRTPQAVVAGSPPRGSPTTPPDRQPLVPAAHSPPRTYVRPPRHQEAFQRGQPQPQPQPQLQPKPRPQTHVRSPAPAPVPNHDRRTVTYVMPHQGGPGQSTIGTTAVVAPLPIKAVAKALARKHFKETSPKGKGGTNWHEEIHSESEPVNSSSCLNALGIVLSSSGTAIMLIGMYLLATEGRRYYLDFGLLAGVVALGLSLLAFRVRRWYLPPNRNFLSGMTVSCALSILETILMTVMAALKPTPGQALGDVLGGGICGVTVLAAALAVAASLSSCCGARPPTDNRVASNTPAPEITPHQAALALHRQGFAL